MIKKTRYFLIGSIIFLSVVSCLILLWLGSSTGNSSEETINEVSMIYMEETAKQLQQKFDAIINLELLQLDGIVRRTPPKDSVYGEDLKNELSLSAQVREFSYVGLYTENGDCDVIYGNDISPENNDIFFKMIGNNNMWISGGIDSDGQKVLLLSAKAEYPMSDGNKSDVIVIGLPMVYLENALWLEQEDKTTVSHIIRADGSYVIRSGGIYSENYFNTVKKQLNDEEMAEEFENNFKSAMEKRENTNQSIVTDEIHSHIYCSHLPNTEWYLIVTMDHGVLDEAVLNLNNTRQKNMIIAGGTILTAILIVCIIYYIMSQRQLKALEIAEKEAIHANKAKSEFLSSMSHDIRTPMNGIIGMTSIAIANIDNKERVRDCLAKITLSSKHLLGLINDVLDMSKIENGKLTLNTDQRSLHEIMQGIVNIAQPQVKAKNQNFDIFIQKIHTEEILCDSVRLNQILLNLLSNAIKFTPENGTINIYLNQEDSPLGDDFVRCNFTVKDTGIGMTPEFQKEIFEKFSREQNSNVSKTEGTGLGMAITKAIVEAMGGSISVKSELGKGSEFRVTVDFEKAEIPEKAMVLPPWKMLVVDDDEELCHSAVEALKDIGVSAEWALDGKTAVEMVEKHHFQRDDYQIVLIDWKMPDMNGAQTATEIRKLLGDDVPILIISAYDWSDIEEEAKAAGVQGFISKPLFKSNLFVNLSNYMNPKEDEDKNTEEADSQSFRGKRILLAEDNDLNWEIAADILSEVGFELERAENGQICVEKFRNSDIGYYDVILMDIRMPVMTGYDAAKEIRKSDRNDVSIPIIAMTADAFSEDIKHCLECGMNAHIAKPIDVNRLIQILKQYLK